MPQRTCSGGLYVGVLLLLLTLDTQPMSCLGKSDGGAPVWPPYCPQGCHCNASQRSSMSQLPRRSIDCSNQGLKSLPSNLSMDLQALLLSGNHLPLKSLMALEVLTNLTELELSSNHLDSLDELRQQPMPFLQYLTVAHNLIDYLNNLTFRTLPTLVYLSVADNKIELMHSNAFMGLTQLRLLDLSHNRIYAVDPLWFRDLASLQKLILSNNEISILRDSDFRFLRELTVLDVSENQIVHIYDSAFRGLIQLRDIRLHGNHLKTVPQEALRQLPQISLLNLGGNHMVKLVSGDLANSTATAIQLNDMTHLVLVERQAFANLPLLQRLELCRNPKLTYIDRGAFVELPSLTTLLLDANSLTCVEQDIRQSLPSLSLLSVQGNPLVCDCVSRWLIQGSSRHLVNGSATLCASPPSLQGKPLTDTTLLPHIPDTCAPRLVPLFAPGYDPVLGDTLELDCRAVGVPTPQMDWLLPDSSHSRTGEGIMVLKAKQSDSGHREVLQSGTLVIHYVQGIDYGDYTCLASNPKGRDERTSHIRVKNLRASVIIMHVSATTVTMTWRSVRYDHQYQILYRLHQANSTYHIIDIKPYMRTYTANQLTPATHYDICMAVKHNSVSIRINCTLVTTRRPEYDHLGITDLRGYVIGGTIGVFLFIISITCTVVYFVKRYNKRRKAQEELFSDNLSQLFLASMDSMSDTTPITYENRGAEMFDEDDLEEIRSTASMATTISSTSTMRC